MLHVPSSLYEECEIHEHTDVVWGTVWGKSERGEWVYLFLEILEISG